MTFLCLFFLLEILEKDKNTIITLLAVAVAVIGIGIVVLLIIACCVLKK